MDMRLRMIPVVFLIVSTHLACGSSSAPPHRDGSAPGDSPAQPTFADAPMTVDAVDAASESPVGVDAGKEGSAVVDAVIDGAAVDGGASALFASSNRMKVLLGFSCWEPEAVTVTNVSGEPLPPIEVSLEAPRTISFMSSGCTGPGLAAGQSCTLQFAVAASSQPGPGQADMVIQAGSSQVRITLLWEGAILGDNFFDANFGPVVVGSGPVLKRLPYVPNPLLQQKYASSLALRLGNRGAFSIVPDPDDCTQGPPRGPSCILQIAFQPPAAQIYQDDVIGGAGCVAANGWLRGQGVLPYDGGVVDSQGQDLGAGLDAPTVDQALDRALAPTVDQALD
jgi:hypothetical protein